MTENLTAVDESIPDAREKRLKRLRYQSWHRGCKETDVILGNYCDQYLDSLSDEEIDLYEAFLNEDDWDIFNWVAYDQWPENKAFHPLVQTLRGFRGFLSY